MRTFALAAALVGLTSGPMAGTAVAQTTAAPSTVQGGDKSESLSTKLNKSDGVITPKSDIDPGIHAEAPDPHPNSTPVVPPAATGGTTAK